MLFTNYLFPIRGQLLLGWEKGREERGEEAGVSVQAGEDTGRAREAGGPGSRLCAFAYAVPPACVAFTAYPQRHRSRRQPPHSCVAMIHSTLTYLHLTFIISFHPHSQPACDVRHCPCTDDATCASPALFSLLNCRPRFPITSSTLLVSTPPNPVLPQSPHLRGWQCYHSICSGPKL